MLDNVPVKVLLIVVRKVRLLYESFESLKLIIGDWQRDVLKRLSEVFKNICEVVTPCLYETITLSIEERSLDHLTHRYAGIPLEKVGRYTKDICIRAPFHKRLRKRCWHYNAEIMQDANDDEDPFFGTMMDLDIFLTCLHKNKLCSFRYVSQR
jgi:hypothetical protein